MRALLLVAALAIVSAVGCGGSQARATAVVPADAHEVRVSLFDIDCSECADRVVSELRKEGAVHSSSFDKRRVVLTVTIAASVGPERVVAAANRAGFRAEIGDRGGAYHQEPAPPAGADVATLITDGRDVPSLAALVVPGKVTLVDFYADWCAHCRDVDKHIMSVLRQRTDVAYRRLNLVDWDTPLAAHYMNGVPHLPYVVVFDGKGAQVDAIAGLDLARLDAAIARATR